MLSFDDIQNLLEPVHPVPRDLAKVYVLGATGAGKTTIIREIMGTGKDAFPNIGNQRTTTVVTEYILRKGDSFEATLVFKEKSDILLDLEETLFDSVDNFLDDLNNESKTKEEYIESIKDNLGETPNQSVRFKYILTSDFLNSIADKIYNQFSNLGNNKETDEILELEGTKHFIEELQKEIYAEIKEYIEKYCGVNLSNVGYYRYESNDRDEFVNTCKKLLSNSSDTLVPVITYARVEGDLLAKYLKDTQVILIDSQGIGHDLNALDTVHYDYFNYSDYILLVEEYRNALEKTKNIINDIFEKSYSNRLKFIFNKLDKSSLDEQQKGVEKVIKNFNSKKLKPKKIGKKDCFYLTGIGEQETQDAIKNLLKRFTLNPDKLYIEIDCNFDIAQYSPDKKLADFLNDWKIKLDNTHWNRTRAFNQRIVSGADGYEELKPVYDLCNLLFNQLDFKEFLQPTKIVTSQEKQKRIDQVKQSFFQHLLRYSRWLVKNAHADLWSEALNISGTGSKANRANSIYKIFQSIAETIKTQTFKERVKYSLDFICAEDPRVKLKPTTVGDVQIKIQDYKIVKYADINLTGLTIIAGENDTGKSTISKAFFNEIKSLFLLKSSLAYPDANNQLNMPIFVDTPDILDKFAYIKTMSVLLQQARVVNDDLPYWVTDLIIRLSTLPTTEVESALFSKIETIINGKVYYSKYNDDILYKKNSLPDSIPMSDTSTGIKMFGILQILIRHQTLKSGSVLILDEPEVHIHPNWQLKYAELIIALVKQDVKILLSSHSPYMIEALIRYGRHEEVGNINLYLTEKQQDNQSIVHNVSKDFGKIFSKLSESFEVFNKLDIEEVEHG